MTRLADALERANRAPDVAPHGAAPRAAEPESEAKESSASGESPGRLILIALCGIG